jgi:recombination protein RecA
MRSAAALRQQIESSLAARIPAALSVRLEHTPELIPTGITEVDALLEGGLPVGSLAEIIGPTCSGRSTLVSSILAGATRQGAACVYVDVADAFDPLSAAAIGIHLGRLLWIRAGRTVEAVMKKPFRPHDEPLRDQRPANTGTINHKADRDTNGQVSIGRCAQRTCCSMPEVFG